MPRTDSKRRIRFQDKSILLKEKPRAGVCALCHRSVAKGEIRKTDLHHVEYDPERPTENTLELCVRCHRRQHAKEPKPVKWDNEKYGSKVRVGRLMKMVIARDGATCKARIAKNCKVNGPFLLHRKDGVMTHMRIENLELFCRPCSSKWGLQQSSIT